MRILWNQLIKHGWKCCKSWEKVVACTSRKCSLIAIGCASTLSWLLFVGASSHCAPALVFVLFSCLLTLHTRYLLLSTIIQTGRPLSAFCYLFSVHTRSHDSRETRSLTTSMDPHLFIFIFIICKITTLNLNFIFSHEKIKLQTLNFKFELKLFSQR